MAVLSFPSRSREVSVVLAIAAWAISAQPFAPILFSFRLRDCSVTFVGRAAAISSAPSVPMALMSKSNVVSTFRQLFALSPN